MSYPLRETKTHKECPVCHEMQPKHITECGTVGCHHMFVPWHGTHVDPTVARIKRSYPVGADPLHFNAFDD